MLCLGHLNVEAGIIPVQNPSFEDPPTATFTSGGIPGWDLVSGSVGSVGVWNINSDPLGWWTVTAPDGNQVAYLGRPGGSASIKQDVPTTVVSGITYVLTGFVGHPSGLSPTYLVGILSGGNLVASEQSTGPQGTFSTFTVTWTGDALNVGQQLGIRLYSDNYQTAFDNIQFTAVPEPSTYLASIASIGLIGMFLVRRRD